MVKVDKIDYKTESYAVEHIAQCPAHDQREPCGQNNTLLFDRPEKIKNEADCKRGNTQEKVEVVTLEFEGATYKHMISDDSIYGHIFYIYDEELKKFKRLEESSELFSKLIAHVDNVD